MLHNEPIYVYTIYENNTNKKTYNTNNFLFIFSDSWQFVIVIFSYVYNTNEKKIYNTNERIYITCEICPIHMKISNTNVQV